MSNRDILASHPSVQDLGIQYGGINLAKTSLHRMLINSKPLHEMSDSDYAAMGPHRSRRAEPKGAKVTVTRNVGGGNSGLPPRSGGAPSAAGGSGGAAAMLPSIGGPTSPASVPRSAHGGRSFSVTNTRNNNTVLNGSAAGGADAPQPFRKQVITSLPPRQNPSLVSSAFSYSADGCSDCGSFSMYSCSCCHVKAPSSVGSMGTSIPSSSVASSAQQRKRNGRKYKVGTTYCERSGSAQRVEREQQERDKARRSSRLSAIALGARGSRGLGEEGDEEEDLDQYENLTSVSQRISNASVTSSQIASLQQELESERRTRLQTQLELVKIRERQQQLLDRLASKDHINMTMDDQYTIRRMLKEVNQQMKDMGVPLGAGANGGAQPAVRGSTVGAPVEASDSVLQ